VKESRERCFRSLKGIEEQMGKRQYLNALAHANELTRELLRLMSMTLKGHKG